jgi:hypothetical protein
MKNISNEKFLHVMWYVFYAGWVIEFPNDHFFGGGGTAVVLEILVKLDTIATKQIPSGEVDINLIHQKINYLEFRNNNF